MRREWIAELEGGEEHGWRVVFAALGAFADARALGGVQRERDGGMTMSGWMDGWWNDVQVALRGLRRAPGFTAATVVTLGLGIGGTTALYAVLDRVVLDALPYPEPERLVRLDNQVPGVGPDEVWALSTAQWVFFSDNATTLDRVGLYQSAGGNVMTPTGPERVQGVRVTADMMNLLGAEPVQGRVISVDDDLPSAVRVALLSHGFWTRVFGRSPDVVGTTIALDGESIEIIGVLAPEVGLPGWPASMTPDIWLPLRVDRAGVFWNSHVFPAIARLADGSTPEAVNAELTRLTARLPEAFPRAYQQEFFDKYGFRTRVTPLKTDVLGDMATNLWILFAGLGLVLVVACTNVVNLFLVRMEGKRRELGVRATLGAGRAVIARYVLAEAMSLALLGGAVGLFIGYWAVPAIGGLAPEGLPRIQGAGLGLGAVGFGLAVSVLVGFALAAYPVWLHGRAASADVLASSGRSSTGSPRRQSVRSAMVVTQVALALTLTVQALMLVQSLQGLYRTDLGFESAGAVSMDVFLSRERYPDDIAIWNFQRSLLERVRSVPGVSHAGFGEELPVAGGYGCTVQGFSDASVFARIEAAGMTTCAGQEVVSPGYFEALGIPIVEGRYLNDGDNDDPGRASVVVSRAFAERFWPGESALGKGVNPGGRTVEPYYHVVGVVGDVPKASDDGRAPLSQAAIAIYYPVVEDPNVEGDWGWWPGVTSLVVKSDVAASNTLAPAIRAAVNDLDPQVPVANLQPMEDLVAAALSEVSFVSLLLAIAAGVSLLLSAVGLYGVVSYGVTARTREIGMRLAIGARPSDVRSQIVAGSMRLAAVGLTAGLVLAVGTSSVLAGLVVGLEPSGWGTYAIGLALLALVALVASWIPARRASGVDPSVALRSES